MQPIIAAGNSGYDLIVPSDYMVKILIAEGNIMALNFDAIPNGSNISADFNDLSYDPTGEYSVPYQWGTTGLGVNTAVVGTDFDRSWGLVFDPAMADAYAGRISLLNDPRETMGAALKYLGYSLNTTDEGELDEAKQLIADTRDRLAAFNTDSADELLTGGETVIGHGYSGDMFTQFLETDNPDDYVYFVPREGGTRWIDNMAVVYDAQSPCTAHTFINFLLRADTGAALSNYNYYSTPNEAAFDGLDEDLLNFVNDPNVIPGGELAGGDPGHRRLRDGVLRRLHRGQGLGLIARAACYKSGSHFNEAGRAEIAVECESLGDPLATHDLEAGGVDIGVLPLVVSSQPLPCPLVDCRVDNNNRHAGRLVECAHVSERMSMAGATPKPCPSLASDQVRGPKRPSTVAP